ncbi:MAG: DNA polymerase III subunit delta [Muribaculaceae bacterium]|nr:DNA polymerase III subunit delta [Muribaculaceae bacterium]
MRFADIPFHAKEKQRLIDMVDNGMVPHALLIQGPEGAGKLSLARAYVQYLHCTSRVNGEPCGQCPACLQHESFNHIDTHFTFPVIKREGGRPTLSDDYISEFRDFLSTGVFSSFERWQSMLKQEKQALIYVDEATEVLRFAGFTSHASQNKVVIIWLPERFHESTANKLLKLIEEPNDNVKIVMVSNNPQGILPTVYSRLQRVEIPRYTEEEVSSWLSGRQSVEEDAARAVARLSAGNMSAALDLVSTSGENDTRLATFISLMRLAYLRKVIDLRAWANDLAALGREQVIGFFNYASRMLRENYIYALMDPRLNCMTDKEETFSRNFSPYVNERNVEELMQVFDHASRDVAGNVSAKIVCFDTAVKVILLLTR